MAGPLDKSMDLSKIFLEITMPSVGTYQFKELKEIDNGPTEDKNTMTDPDIYGTVRTIENKVSKREIKITTAKGSDDHIFLLKCLNQNRNNLGTLTYIDDTGDNKLADIGQGVSVQKSANNKNNTKDIDVEFVIQCAKYTEGK